jgi:zeaxanthin epoxidase
VPSPPPPPHCPQEILADACREIAGDGVILNSVRVVDYEQGVDPATGKQTVTAIAEDGRRFTGDLLVGADGIWSKVGERRLGDAPRAGLPVIDLLGPGLRP